MTVRILIADDNEDNLYMLETLLKSVGYEVVSAKNGEIALHKLKGGPFDLIVSDILMPVMDGFQLCRECKKDPALRAVPIVFYTATYTDDKDEKLATALGSAAYIRKPVEPHVLLRSIRDVVERTAHSKAPKVKPATQVYEQQALALYNQRLVEKLENKMLDLKRSQTLYQNLWENVNDLIFALDEHNRIIDINHCNEILGYDEKDAIGKRFTDFLLPESRKIVEDHLAAHPKKKDGRSQLVYEVTMRNKDGNTVSAELGISTVYVDGVLVGKYGIAHDITARRKAEDALKKTAAQLEEQKESLQQKNMALKEVLAQIEAERADTQKQITENICRLAMPILRKLRDSGSHLAQKEIDVLENTLRDLTSRFGAKVSADAIGLTPRQIELCNMIRSGLSSKDMAEALGVSVRTIETHRNTIRKKLGISGKDASLAAALQSLAQ